MAILYISEDAPAQTTTRRLGTVVLGRCFSSGALSRRKKAAHGSVVSHRVGRSPRPSCFAPAVDCARSFQGDEGVAFGCDSRDFIYRSVRSGYCRLAAV